MSDLEFSAPAAPRTLASLAASAGTPIPSAADAERPLVRFAALDRAGPDEITVFEAEADLDDLAATRAGACLVPPWAAPHVPGHTVALVAEDPRGALLRAIAMFHAENLKPKLAAGVGLDISARIDAEARLEQGASIGPFVVVGPRVEIGAGTTIGAHCIIGDGVRIGRHCRVDGHVSIRNALVGDRVTIHAGARIGCAAPGFGPNGAPIGRVIIQDGVEIGANATIERGLLHDTVVGEGSTVGPLAAIVGETTLDRRSRVAGGGFCLSSQMV